MALLLDVAIPDRCHSRLGWSLVPRLTNLMPFTLVGDFLVGILR